jgi:hypothetical protein
VFMTVGAHRKEAGVIRNGRSGDHGSEEDDRPDRERPTQKACRGTRYGE